MRPPLPDGVYESQVTAAEAKRALLAAYRDAAEPPRPQTPPSLSGLLTGAEGEPRLGAELEAEIATAERIGALVSFVTWEGRRRMSIASAALAIPANGPGLSPHHC